MPIAEVAIQSPRYAIVDTGRTARVYLIGQAILLRGGVESDIVADIEVEFAIPIYVAKRSGGAPGLGLDARGAGHILEAIAAQVMQQNPGLVTAYIEVGKPVVVVIADGAAQEMAGETIET